MKQILSLSLLATAALLMACGSGGGTQPLADAGSCTNGRSSCSGACVDLQSDPTNCGACGFGCGQGTVCFSGLCLSSCGNGQLQTGEQCDDNNRQNGDGCTSNCQREQGYACTGTPSVCTTRCGDGVKAPIEACDDGANASGDGCSAACALESGFSCAGEPSVCSTVCGDGVIRGNETCDDSDATAGDGCSATCTTETGFQCSGAPSSCVTICGDSMRAGNETCDDGNTTSGNGCSSTCQVETGYSCTTGTPNLCTPVCGNGLRHGNEQCDDGDTQGGDGCSASCTLESGFVCNTANPNLCTTTCGDSIRAGNEQCDDGNLSNTDGCTSSCTVKTGYSCNTASPNVCVTNCGDGIRAGAETCDDGNTTSGNGCSSTCALETGFSCDLGTPNVCAPICGDGLRRGNEACDDGNTTSGNGCSSTCTVEAGYSCNTASPSVCTATCGNGLKTGNEACDDGNTTTGDGCSSSCALETGFNCTTTSPTACTPVCGDSLRRGTEECDDGNTTAGNGCSASCTVEPGYSCNTATPNVCAPICGDGQRLGSEVCDDGNTSNGDGCSASCAPETGFTCNGASPTVCSSICSDGLRRGSEGCDDGDIDPGDGCSASCQVETGYRCTGFSPDVCTIYCGDAVVFGTEQCDDGNTTSGDCCSSTCTREPGCEIEPNDTQATANNFSALSLDGGSIRAFLGDGGTNFASTTDMDVFSVVLDGGDSVVVFGTGTGAYGSACATNEIDNYITVRRSDGSVVAFNDDAEGYCALVYIRGVPAGVYFVEVSMGGTGLTPSDYQLLVSRGTCGNGTRERGEQCEDGNANNLDSCRNDCSFHREVENNDLADSGTPMDAGWYYAGAVNPATDPDYFMFVVPYTADVRVETFDGMGPSTCASINTIVSLYSPTVVALATDDNDGVNSCSLIQPLTDTGARQLSAGTYYVRVGAALSSAAIPEYVVKVDLLTRCGNAIVEGFEQCDGTANCDAACKRIPVCGDGILDGAETCDDGNTTPNDGCSATCQRETTAEVEPNNTTAEATTNTVQINGGKVISGAIGTVGDVDYFRLTVGAATAVRIESFDGTGASCTSISTTVTLYDSAGTALYVDDTGAGIADCGAIVAYLAAGTYFVSVEDQLGTATIPAYTLEVKSLLNGGAETEPNNTSATGNVLSQNDVYVFGGHLTNSDLDTFKINVPAGKSVRAEIIEGDLVETCESNGVDSKLDLIGPTSAILQTDDDQGRGYCSKIDGTGPAGQRLHTNASGLPAGVYDLRVGAYSASSASGQFNYRLVVTVR